MPTVLVNALVIGLGGALDHGVIEIMARLALLAGIGALSYFLLLRILAPRLMHEAIALLRRQPPQVEVAA